MARDQDSPAGGRQDNRRQLIRTVTIYACAALGGLIASIADIVQKEEASAVVKITSLSARHLQVAVAPVSVLLLLVLLAAGLCFVFQPANRKASFSVGIGIIAIIMTLTPYRQPPTGSAELASSRMQFAALAAPRADGPLWLAQAPADGQIRLSLEIENPFAKPMEVQISVYDGTRKQEYRQRRSIRRSGSFSFNLPGNTDLAAVRYSVEVDDVRTSMGIIGSATRMNINLAEELEKAGRSRQSVSAAIAQCGRISCEGAAPKQFLQQLFQPKRW